MKFIHKIFILPHVTMNILSMLLFACIVTTVIYHIEKNENSKNSLSGKTSILLHENSTITLKEVFNHRLEDYKEDLKLLESNLQLQAVLVIITILLILRTSDKLSFFSNDVPLKWLHLFVPILLLYLWLKFGFLLDNLIEGRKQAIDLLKYNGIEKANIDAAKSFFSDAGFIDGWFISFIDEEPGEYSGIRNNSEYSHSTKAFLTITLGLIISTGHACILGLTLIGFRRFTRLRYKNWLTIYYLLPLIPLSLLLASHFQFYFGGDNNPLIQKFIFCAVWPLLFFLVWKSVNVDIRRNQRGINNLRRKRVMVHNGPQIKVKHNPYQFRAIALIGDSLSTSFHVDTKFNMLKSIWRDWENNWFFNEPNSSNGINSVFERLGEHTHFIAYQHACATAKINRNLKRSFKDVLTDTWHFKDQVNEVLIGKFPQIVIVWIGHNSLNWKEQENNSLEKLVEDFITSYKIQLERLVVGGINSKQNCLIHVFGLINFDSFFKARFEAENLKLTNSKLYPFLEKDYHYFVAMRPEYRKKMIELSKLYNVELKKLCEGLSEKITETKVKLVYSEVLSKINIDEAYNLNAKDAWHPSIRGHKKIAEVAYEEIYKGLAYLNWK